MATKILENSWLAKLVKWFGFSAITIGQTIHTTLNLELHPKLLAHEKRHTEQWKRHGIILFPLLYILEFLWNLLWCWNFRKAYLNISLEKEARIAGGNL